MKALALSTSVDTTSDSEARRTAARRARYDALAVVRRETRLRSKATDADGVPLPGRLQLCRRAVQDLAGGVSVMVSRTPDGNTGGLSGVQTCGSVWACPVCSEKINAGRQAELDAGITAWLAAGHSVAFLTLTVKHHKGHRLADLWDAISPAWNRTTSGAGVAWNGGKVRKDGSRVIGDKERFGIAGYVRVVETKHGASGWHPHVHALLFLDKPLTDEQLDDLRHRMFGRWEAALVKAGYSAAEWGWDEESGRMVQVGAVIRRVTDGGGMADYFAKNTYGITPGGAAYEVTGSHSKRAGKGGATPFQLLEQMVETGDADLLDLWHEWEAASHGRRQLTWSRAMRDLLALGVELTDEELAEQQLDGDVAVVLTRDEWVAGRWWERVPDLLDAVEAGTLHELLDFIPHRRFFEASSGSADRRRAAA